MKVSFVVLFAVVIAAVNAACDRVDVKVVNADELSNALLSANPGYNIILEPIEYFATSLFEMKASGVQDCPIVVACETPGEAVISSPLDLTGTSFVTISNITLSDRTNSHGFLLDGCSDVVLENIHITHFAADGIKLLNSKYVTVRNCTFDYLTGHRYASNQRGIVFTGTSHSTVELCTFGDNIENTPVIFFSDCNNNTISENIFYGHSNFSFSWVGSGRDVRTANNVISRNFFENPDGQVMYSCLDFSYTSNTLFKENLIIVNNGQKVRYAIVGGEQGKVCASNRVFGTENITDGEIDPSC